jgi:1-acyl-sn-glycerol-3-phosphate acyltransferase
MRSVGCFPVKRGSADLDAMRAGKKLLDSGDAMLVFPEGTRQSGDEIAEIFDGAAWLAAKSQALVVPVGIAGSEAAMPSGSKGIKRVPVAIVVGDPMSPPGSAGQRASRAELKAWTAELRTVLMELQERAEVLNQR